MAIDPTASTKGDAACSEQMPSEYRQLADCLIRNNFYYYIDSRASGSIVCCKHRDEDGRLYGPCFWVVKKAEWIVYEPGGHRGIVLRESDYLEAIIAILEASNDCMTIGLDIHRKYGK